MYIIHNLNKVIPHGVCHLLLQRTIVQSPAPMLSSSQLPIYLYFLEDLKALWVPATMYMFPGGAFDLWAISSAPMCCLKPLTLEILRFVLF